MICSKHYPVNNAERKEVVAVASSASKHVIAAAKTRGIDTYAVLNQI